MTSGSELKLALEAMNDTVVTLATHGWHAGDFARSRWAEFQQRSQILDLRLDDLLRGLEGEIWQLEHADKEIKRLRLESERLRDWASRLKEATPDEEPLLFVGFDPSETQDRVRHFLAEAEQADNQIVHLELGSTQSDRLVVQLKNELDAVLPAIREGIKEIIEDFFHKHSHAAYSTETLRRRRSSDSSTDENESDVDGEETRAAAWAVLMSAGRIVQDLKPLTAHLSFLKTQIDHDAAYLGSLRPTLLTSDVGFEMVQKRTGLRTDCSAKTAEEIVRLQQHEQLLTDAFASLPEVPPADVASSPAVVSLEGWLADDHDPFAKPSELLRSFRQLLGEKKLMGRLPHSRFVQPWPELDTRLCDAESALDRAHVARNDIMLALRDLGIDTRSQASADAVPQPSPTGSDESADVADPVDLYTRPDQRFAHQDDDDNHSERSNSSADSKSPLVASGPLGKAKSLFRRLAK
jgi:hypothetical protein